MRRFRLLAAVMLIVCCVPREVWSGEPRRIPARVTEFKKMKFEIRVYSTFAGNAKNDEVLSEACARVAMSYLTSDGAPAWRLTAMGARSETPAAGRSATYKLMVEFTRTK